MTKRFFIIAGEASGDKLGAELMAGILSLDPTTEFQGVGGPLMQAQGLSSLFDMSELSVMGIAEVLPKLKRLFALRDLAAAAVVDMVPDALITIDSPDFCRRVSEVCKRANPALKTIHYVAPSVWAWRPKRAVKMAKSVDHVLALLPFEPPYMQRAGMSCDFVGHPVAAEPKTTPQQCQDFRLRHGVEPDAKLICVLPGSRRGEVSRLLPIFGEVVDQLGREMPNIRVILPTLPHLEASVRGQVSSWKVAPIVISQDTSAIEFSVEKRAAFAASDVALAASGTVSLELAAAGTPMVIAYDMNFISRLIIAKMLKVDTVTLVNLVTGTKSVPEFLGNDCVAEKITPTLQELLVDKDKRHAQTEAFDATMKALGQNDPDLPLLPARSVLQFVG
jgi:lipid-A-disaccharide synthase